MFDWADFLYQSLPINIFAGCHWYFTAYISLKNGFNQVTFPIPIKVLNSSSVSFGANNFLTSSSLF